MKNPSANTGKTDRQLITEWMERNGYTTDEITEEIETCAKYKEVRAYYKKRATDEAVT